MRVRLLLGYECCWGMCVMHKQLDVNNFFYFEGVLSGGQSHGHDVSVSTYYSGNGGSKFSKKSGLHQKFEGIESGVGTAASSIRGAKFHSPKLACKGKLRVFG